MMNLCVRCKQRPAMVFISKIEGDNTKHEGLCIKCARELNIPQVTDMLKNFNISEEELDSMTEQFMESMTAMMEQQGEDGEMLADGDFEAGGAQAFPFLKNERNLFPF